MKFGQLVFEFIFSKKGDSPSLLARKNDLALRIAIIFIILAVPYVVIFRYLHMGEIETMVMATIGFLSLSIVLNRVKAYSISKALLVIGPTLTFFGSANILGPEAGAQFLLFTLVALPLLLFDITKIVWILMCMLVPMSAHIALELGRYEWLPHGAYLDPKILLYIRCFVIVTTFLLLVLSGGAYFLSNRRYELELEEKNQELESKNTDLQTAYEDIQAQQNLLEKTWQEYGFTSKLSGTLRLSEIVDLTAKTILLHFGLTYAATITSNNTSTLHTWTLENQIPVRTREDSFESQICYTYEKGPILPLSVAHLSTSVLDIMNPTPSLVLHLAITENESRYILIGPKNSGVAFSESDMKLLNALSTQAIIALQRALPYEEAVNRYGMAIKQESAYQMLVSLQHQINSPLSAAKMAMDTLSKTPMETNMSIITKIGKEALDSVAAVMRRMRQVSQLKETNYLGDIKMWDIGDPDET